MAVRKVSPAAIKDSSPCLTNVKWQNFLGITLHSGGLFRMVRFFCPNAAARGKVYRANSTTILVLYPVLFIGKSAGDG